MIDLYSDTLTKPTSAMRRAMADAEVADEQRREDPTTNRLQAMVAELLGKEAAVFLPSGTMCNEVAIKTHTQPGDSILCDAMSHIHRSEFGGPAALSGVTVEAITTQRGIFTPGQVTAALEVHTGYGPTPQLLCVENTHNFGGGTVWPIERLRAVSDVAHRAGLKTHMDGARLMNACVASGILAREIAAPFDSVWLDLSKGLGCPVGAVLAASKEFIDRAWRWKHMFGGAMRQSGILAAAGIYALEHHVERLAEDHANARLLAEGLATIRGIKLAEMPETNIVFFEPSDISIEALNLVTKLKAAGMGVLNVSRRIRAVTHLDVSRQDVEQAVDIVRKVLA